MRHNYYIFTFLDVLDGSSLKSSLLYAGIRPGTILLVVWQSWRRTSQSFEFVQRWLYCEEAFLYFRVCVLLDHSPCSLP